MSTEDINPSPRGHRDWHGRTLLYLVVDAAMRDTERLSSEDGSSRVVAGDGMHLDDYLRRCMAEGCSWASIAVCVSEDSGVSVSPGTVRRWGLDALEDSRQWPIRVGSV